MYILYTSHFWIVLGFCAVLSDRGFCYFVYAIAVASVEKTQCTYIFETDITFMWFSSVMQYFQTEVSVSGLRGTETSVRKSCTKLHLSTRNVNI